MLDKYIPMHDQSDILRVTQHHRLHRPVKEMNCPQLVRYCCSLRMSRTQTGGSVHRAADTSADCCSVRIKLTTGDVVALM